MKETNQIKIDVKTLQSGISGSPTTTTESKDVAGEIRMFRDTTTLAYGIEEISKAVCDPEARMKWVERMAAASQREKTP